MCMRVTEQNSCVCLMKQKGIIKLQQMCISISLLPSRVFRRDKAAGSNRLFFYLNLFLFQMFTP